MFFAVPHRGMDVEDMITAIKHRNTSEKRLSQISKDESYWRHELDNFVNIIKNCKVASFYETALTRRLIRVCISLHAVALHLTITETRRIFRTRWRVYNCP